jgi:hypothetical protein
MVGEKVGAILSTTPAPCKPRNNQQRVSSLPKQSGESKIARLTFSGMTAGKSRKTTNGIARNSAGFFDSVPLRFTPLDDRARGLPPLRGSTSTPRVMTETSALVAGTGHDHGFSSAAGATSLWNPRPTRHQPRSGIFTGAHSASWENGAGPAQKMSLLTELGICYRRRATKMPRLRRLQTQTKLVRRRTFPPENARPSAQSA